MESALRVALHQAGAAALAELLKFEAPAAEQRQLPCPCGHHAQYQELRSKPVVTIVGKRLSAAEKAALSYAVGEWARVWPLQSLVRAMGAYFVRRNSKDALYRKVLERYVAIPGYITGK